MPKNKRIIFLTGVTGLLGSYLLKIFLEEGHKVYALARSNKDKTAKQRIQDILSFWKTDFPPNLLDNLIVIEGDITYKDFGIKSQDAINELYSEVEFIFNNAALAKMRVPLDIIRNINVEGTRNVLNLALKCKKLQKFNHISTAYVVGTKYDVDFNEDMLEMGQGFCNTYEQTKYEAEVLVNTYKEKGFKAAIFRPSMIMGDSITGQTNDFRLFYEPLHFFSQQIYAEFPADTKCYQNLVNVDTVAKAAVMLGLSQEEGVYHLVSQEHTLVGDFFNLASEFFGFRMPKFVALDKFNFNQLTFAQKALADPYIPYLNNSAKFSSEKTCLALQKHNFSRPKIDKDNLLRILSYCGKRGFIKKKK